MSPTPRASSITCGRSRGPRWRGSCATSCPTGRRSARCRCERPTTASTCPGSPARAAAVGTGAPPASPPSSISPRWSSSCARRLLSNSKDGVILADKPAGVTSHDVVARIRRTFPRRTRVGHAGTLDPFATGLLLVLVGRATRAQRFLMALPKTYRAVARLGWTPDTGDRDGRLAHTGRVPETLDLPAGPIMQRPPAYSAVKVGGE